MDAWSTSPSSSTSSPIASWLARDDPNRHPLVLHCVVGRFGFNRGLRVKSRGLGSADGSEPLRASALWQVDFFGLVNRRPSWNTWQPFGRSRCFL